MFQAIIRPQVALGRFISRWMFALRLPMCLPVSSHIVETTKTTTSMFIQMVAITHFQHSKLIRARYERIFNITRRLIQYIMDTLWIGASKIDGIDFRHLGINTLVDFFVIYAPCISRWISNDATVDHTTELIALEVNLGLCMYTYDTSMTFGMTTTDRIGEPINPNGQVGQ